jgi:hypothetical protein
MKKFVLLIVIIGIAVFFFGTRKGRMVKNVAVSYVSKPEYINKEGSTVSKRSVVPEGFIRKIYPEGSFQNYIQQYPLKPYGTKVINYDGEDYV